MPYTFGVVENGDVMLLKDDENEPIIFCHGLQNVPIRLLASLLYDQPEERCILIERRMQLKNEKYTDCLRKFADQCKQAGLVLNEIYNFNLEMDIIPEKIIDDLYSGNNCEYIPERELTSKGPGCYPQWRKGEMYYPCITRPFLKPVTKLFTPRILTGELNYPDVPLVEHMVDGDNFDLDKKYEQV